jgi:hypothetical protein
LSANEVLIRVANESSLARPPETVVLQWKQVRLLLPEAKPDGIQISDDAGRPLAVQTTDLDGDRAPDEILFQAEFSAGQSKSFTLSFAAEARKPAMETKVYARFVPENADDFAWENDRMAYRLYGPACERTVLVSSGVDVWCKRTSSLVLDKWYRRGDYHVDHGEGMDCYTVGPGRGCGGVGIWQDGELYVSKNFSSWRILATGPIRVVFELTYRPWEVKERKISEVKRISLDAGQNLNRMESRFQVEDRKGAFTAAIGITDHRRGGQFASSLADDWLGCWENADDQGKPGRAARDGSSGQIGCGVVLDPAALGRIVQAENQWLALIPAAPGRPVIYYAGAGWSRGGFPTAKGWFDYLEQFARRLRSPLQVTVSLK